MTAASEAARPRPLDQRALAIAIVCYPGLGGSGVIASELARGLASRGHRVFVLATGMPDRLRINGVKFVPVEVPSSPVFEHGPYGLAVASHVVELVRREAIDVVHLHYAIPHASSALLAAQVLGAAAPAMVVTLHGTDVTQLGAHPSLHAVTAFAIAACDGVTTPSRYLRGEAAGCFGLPAERIEVISNFVDVDRFAPPPHRDRSQLARLFDSGAARSPLLRSALDSGPDAARPPRALGLGSVELDGPILFHVSNFRSIKRPLDLIEVLARVRRELPARMVLVGDGPEHVAVAERAAALGLDHAICSLGRRDDFAGLLGHADGFVLPSETESFGVAALESMAAGVPVFGYRVGGLPEVVAEGAGTLVPRGDIGALAAAILAGVRDRDVMGHAARARAERHFRSDRVIATYEAYFQRVLASRASARLS